MNISYSVRAWLYLIFVIPSTLCTLFNLYYFLLNRTLRQALNNHVIIILLCLGLLFNLTDIIWYIYEYRTGGPLSSTYIFCIIWSFLDYAIFISVLLLVAWGSIERHILIFHPHLLATRAKRFLFHYLPLIIITIYPFIYYSVIFFVLPCDIPINYERPRCYIDYCAYATEWMGQWDNIAHNIVPIFTIVIFSIALLARTWYNKYRIRQRFQWKNYRRMSIQLLSVSMVYFVLYFPTVFMYTLYVAGIYFDNMDDYFSAAYYLCYFVILLTPFVCTVSLPELRAKIHKITRICRRASRRIGPTILTMDHQIVGRRDVAK